MKHKILIIFFVIIPFLAQAQTFDQSVLNLINSERTKALRLNPILNQKAQIRADYLCNHPFSHDDWKESFKNTKFSWIGENLAKNFPNIDLMHRALMNSFTHRVTIQNPKFRFLGIGNACNIVVELFGS